MVVPTGNNAGASFVVVATPQLSAVVGAVKETVAPQTPKSLLTETAAAQVIEGASLSVTVTDCVQVFVLP